MPLMYAPFPGLASLLQLMDPLSSAALLDDFKDMFPSNIVNLSVCVAVPIPSLFLISTSPDELIIILLVLLENMFR